MEDKVREDRQLMKVDESAIEQLSLEDAQLAEQLYYSAGLDPVVDAGLGDYDKHIERENKLINKVLGPRGTDIRGYGESVAKRVAFAIYSVLNKQYGGKVGDMRSYIMALEDERNRANDKFDDLMARVVGILGNEYKELRTDSKAFMEKLTTILGEDIKESKIDQAALAERLADIDGLREQIKALTGENAEQKKGYESQIAGLKDEHGKEIAELNSRVDGLESKVRELESEKEALKTELAQLEEDYGRLKAAVTALGGNIPYQQIREELTEELYEFLLKDSKVPHMVIDGVGKFIDFRKYLGIAVEKGATKAGEHAEKALTESLQD